MPDWRNMSNTTLGMMALGAVAVVGVLIYVVIAMQSSDGGGPQGVYVSMGDSVAAGEGASDPSTTSFAVRLAGSEDAPLLNFAAPGATTQMVIDEQVPRVLPILRGGRARFITISAGGNDLAALIPNAACTQDPPPAECPLDQTLDGVEQRIDELLRLLREADPEVPIVLLGYPNFFSGTGHAWDAPAGRVLPELVNRLQAVASRYERVVVAKPSFDDRGGALTHVLDEPFNPHPNDAGHRVIAEALVAALAEARQ